MQITILDRNNYVTYDEIPYGGNFLWRHQCGDEARLFVKPSADTLKMGDSPVQAIEVNRGTIAKFDNSKERAFLPVIIVGIELELK